MDPVLEGFIIDEVQEPKVICAIGKERRREGVRIKNLPSGEATAMGIATVLTHLFFSAIRVTVIMFESEDAGISGQDPVTRAIVF